MQRFLFPLMFLLLPLSLYAETVRIANGEWPPFMSEQYLEYGVASHIVSDAFATQGISVEYEFFPWSRAYQQVRSKQIDASIIWSKTPQRSEEVLFSEPLENLATVLFYREGDTIEWAKPTTLYQKRFGVTKGYFYGNAIELAAKSGLISVSVAKDDLTNLRKLLASRIDVFPVSLDVGMAILQEHFSPEEISRLTYDPNPLKEVGYRVIFQPSEKGERLREIFNKGLKQLKEKGNYEDYWLRSRSGGYLIKH